jgi:hypothetical protein
LAWRGDGVGDGEFPADEHGGLVTLTKPEGPGLFKELADCR